MESKNSNATTRADLSEDKALSSPTEDSILTQEKKIEHRLYNNLKNKSGFRGFMHQTNDHVATDPQIIFYMKHSCKMRIPFRDEFLLKSGFGTDMERQSKKVISKFLTICFPVKLNQWMAYELFNSMNGEFQLSKKVMFRNIARVTKELTIKHSAIKGRYLEQLLICARHLKFLVFKDCFIGAEFTQAIKRFKELSGIKLNFLHFIDCNLSDAEEKDGKQSKLKRLLQEILGTAFCISLRGIKCTEAYEDIIETSTSLYDLKLQELGIIATMEPGTLLFNFDYYTLQ
ncbi:unnamed protein product [Moneuplotes crassus]|uniref:Uncharacterized protein n=1 Tax=Euplotes crassus TaxID=5936 RepID=A0AAD1UDE8_EUPCR|nr:unnamed protein product [Moneuplotes crassus]